MLQEFINFTLKHKKPEPAFKKYVYELARKAHCFKLEPIVRQATRCTDPEKIVKPALPFKECWFEPLENDTLFALYPENKSLIIFIKGILIEEKTPYNYDLYLYMTMKDGDSVHNITPICMNKEFIERIKTEENSLGLFLIEMGYYNAIEFIEKTLERMQQNEMIVVKNPRKVKATGKPNFTINQYIKITNQKRVYGESANKKENFEYSYRFEVRGHWRKLPEGSMGKDRNGEYSIEGYTWVNEYEKGSKDLPLLKKTRIIE